jgi:RNA polymerase sigma factor (TIGR02999 family)
MLTLRTRAMDGMTEHDITGLLHAWRGGDEQALQQLTPHVYAELHRAAQRCMRDERPGHILQTTALINELYLRLARLKEFDWQNRTHFFALCARQMRRILTDDARARETRKRNTDAHTITLTLGAPVSASASADVLAVDQALLALAKIDERKAQVVELRYFGGLTVDETAQVLQISAETVHRDWRAAKAWLLRELS